MEDSLVPRKRPAANMDLDDLMGETVEDDETFINNANIVSNTSESSPPFNHLGLIATDKQATSLTLLVTLSTDRLPTRSIKSQEDFSPWV
jgi:hypothetical protein